MSYYDFPGPVEITGNCSGTYEHGQIVTPGYPNDYLKHGSCSWDIEGTTGMMNIELSFLDFQTEPTHDFLYVYDGNTSSYNQIAELSGYSRPGNIVSTRNQLHLRWIADHSVQRRGFKIIVGSIEVSGTCNGTYNNLRREITTPQYPNKYLNNGNCSWDIGGPPGTKFELIFKDFDTEKNYDFLYIYDGNSQSSNQIAAVTQTTPTPSGPDRSGLSGSIRPGNVFSTGNRLHLQWKTDDTRVRKGFKIEIAAESYGMYQIC